MPAKCLARGRERVRARERVGERGRAQLGESARTVAYLQDTRAAGQRGRGALRQTVRSRASVALPLSLSLPLSLPPARRWWRRLADFCSESLCNFSSCAPDVPQSQEQSRAEQPKAFRALAFEFRILARLYPCVCARVCVCVCAPHFLLFFFLLFCACNLCSCCCSSSAFCQDAPQQFRIHLPCSLRRARTEATLEQYNNKNKNTHSHNLAQVIHQSQRQQQQQKEQQDK